MRIGNASALGNWNAQRVAKVIAVVEAGVGHQRQAGGIVREQRSLAYRSLAAAKADPRL